MKKPTTYLTLFIFLFVFFGCKNEISRDLEGYTFDGQYAEIERSNSGLFTESITIDMYVKLHHYPSAWTGIVSKMKSDTQNEFNLRIQNADNAQWYYGDGSRAIVMNWTPKEVLPLDQWTRLTAIRNIEANELSLYANGVLVANRVLENLPKAQATSSNIFLMRQANRPNTLDATIADLVIYNKALSPEEIQKSGQSLDNPKKKENLIGYWHFGHIENDNVPDKSENSPNAYIKPWD